jgi:hypothetical protein
MKWIKASERQPKRQVCAKKDDMYGVLFPWFDEEFYFITTDFNERDGVNVTGKLLGIEWLDESESPQPSAPSVSAEEIEDKAIKQSNMTQEEIIHGNKLIAEFMGLEYTTKKYWKIGDITGNNQLFELHYHTSWDWLMPVVEKCNAIIHHSKYVSNDLQRALCAVDIKLIFLAVVEFIKWYNPQTLPPKD